MPPKKKSGKKGKKSGKKSGKAKDTAAPIADVVDELSKEFFILHIKDLERRLVRYQTKYEELKKSNDAYAQRFDELSHDKKQRVTILKKSLEQRGDEIADLRDRLIGLQQAKESEKESFEAQLQQLRTEFQEMKDKLTSENNVLAAKLAALEEFKVAKEGLLAKYASMEEDLQQMLEQHEMTLQLIDKKTVMDRDRLKKEMVMRVNQVAAEFRKVSNRQMAETTKRTIRENVSIQTQLAKMADKNAELVQENEELKTRQRKQKHQINQYEKNHNELAKKNSSESRVLVMLEEKKREQEELIQEYEEREKFLSNLEEESEQIKSRVEEKREEMELFGNEIEMMEESINAREDEVQQLDEAMDSVKSVVERCGVLMQSLLQSAHPRLTASKSDMGSGRTGGKFENEENEGERTEKLLTELLMVLENQVAEGIPVQLQSEETTRVNQHYEFSDESSLFHDSYDRVQSADTISGKGIRKGSLPPLREVDYNNQNRRLCEPGVLQLVPSVNRHIPTFVEKTRTPIGGSLDQRAVQKNIGIQTASAAKAMFAAEQILRPHRQ